MYLVMFVFDYYLNQVHLNELDMIEFEYVEFYYLLNEEYVMIINFLMMIN